MVNTFLPYSSFTESARCLDNRRLNKQIQEAYQILCILLDIPKADGSPRKGYKHHPAVLMWKNYEYYLVKYLNQCIMEAWDRKIKVKPFYFSYFVDYGSDVYQFNYMVNEIEDYVEVSRTEEPPFLNNPDFHLSHRSNLYRKDPEHYKWFKDVGPDLPYFWPTKEMAIYD